MNAKIKNIIFYFILLQPFLDFYWFYNGKLADILPFTLPTIFRILACGVIFLMLYSQKSNWQKLSKDKWLIVYLCLLIAYCLAHLIHVKTFTSVNPNDYNYSTTSEIFYLIRMFLPLFVLYLTKELSFTKESFKDLIQLLSLIFSATIVLSNLFVISLRSYGDGFISANIFSWFSGKIGYSHLASKGFFNFSNMISAVLFMLLPLIIYYLLSEFDWKILLTTTIQALAMVEIGTKVALAGLIGGIIICLIVYLLHVFLFKDAKLNKKAILALVAIEVGGLAITPFTPAIQRYRYENYLAQLSDHNLKAENAQLEKGLAKASTKKEKDEFLKGFIRKNYKAYALNPKFVFKSYSYQYDPEFWLGIMKEPGDLRLQNRHLEIAMLNQVRATNNNRLDKVLGISYTRESNIFNLERDFLSQVYSLGWLGMLLFVGPYLAILLYAIINWLARKENRNFLTSSLLVAISFILAAAFFSGNVMDFLTASFILAFVSGYLLSLFKKNKFTA